MRCENEKDWWELRVNGILITTIMGRGRAEWFLENMRVVDRHGTWELISTTERPWAKPITPAQANKKIEVQYCVGSD